MKKTAKASQTHIKWAFIKHPERSDFYGIVFAINIGRTFNMALFFQLLDLDAPYSVQPIPALVERSIFFGGGIYERKNEINLQKTYPFGDNGFSSYLCNNYARMFQGFYCPDR